MSTGFAESPTTSPPAAPEEPLYEVVNGVRVDLPPMSIYSNVITGRIFNQMNVYLSERAIGTAVMEALLILDREGKLRRRPDVAFVATDRWPLDREVPETGDWEVVPTIAVEVTSTHDTFSDVHSKVIEYFEHGVEEVWVVFPDEQQIYRYTSPTDADIQGEHGLFEGGERLPGFSLKLSDLFRRKTGSTSVNSSVS